MLFFIVSFLISIRNFQVGVLDYVSHVGLWVTSVLTSWQSTFWSRYSSTYSLFWPEELPFWHPRCIASLHSSATLLEEMAATLTYPYPTRFVCVFKSDLATYAVLLTCFLLMTLGTYVGYSLIWWFLGLGNPIGHYWSTRFTNPFKVMCASQADITRPAFNDLTLRPAKPLPNHTHPEQASLRAAVTNAIQALALSIGFVAYFVQRSKSDNRKGLDGCETVVWCKDAHRAPVAFAPKRHNLIALVDTSDYIDMNLVLAEGLPTVLYTVVPSAAAAVRKEYSYTFDDCNRLIYDVKGGAHYEQEIWDTGVDMVTSVAYSRTGLFLNKTIFNVDRKFVDADHQMILFSPCASYSFPLFDLNSWINSPMRRLQPVQDGWIRIRVLGEGEQPLRISTARCGGYIAAEVGMGVDGALAETAALSKNALQATTTQTLTKLPAAECAILTSYHRENAPEVCATVYHVDESVVRYQHVKTYEQDAKTLLVPYMTPFGPECFLPQDTRGNREVAIAARIQKNVSSVTELPPLTESALREFAHYVIKKVGQHTLFPVTEDEVRENQPRPAQQHIIDDGTLVAELPDPELRVRAFEKAEPAQKVAAPRIISPDEPAHKTLWSRFMIPLHKAMIRVFGKDGKGWYAPGMTPAEIAERVSAICQSESEVTMADGDKYDSSISPVERAWEGEICYGVFHPSTHLELEKGLKASHCCPVVLGGLLYEMLCGRGSGFADTTVGNTMWNMAKDYVTARTERGAGGCRTPKEARARLGIYMGDDSLSKYLPTEHLMQTGALLGLVLEVEQKKCGEPGVNFISRFYGPYVWNGDGSSTCDLPRICSKIHVAPNMPMNSLTPAYKLVQRMLGLKLSDRNTPLIGPYAVAVMAVYGPPEEVNRDLAGFYAELPKSVQFPNDNVNGWMEAFWTERCPNLMLDIHEGHLQACVLDPSLFLRPPLFFRPVPIVTAPDMATDALSTASAKPFPAMIHVELSPEERVDLRDAVNDAAKTGSLSVKSGMTPVGTCSICTKQFLAPLLSDAQRANLDAGLPIRCRGCLPPGGSCSVCKKDIPVGELNTKNREKLEHGKAFNCRPCGKILWEKYEAKGKSEMTAPRGKT